MRGTAFAVTRSSFGFCRMAARESGPPCYEAKADRIGAAVVFRKGGAVVWTIFVILLVLWLLGYFAFHVTSGLIHLILVVAVIVLILGLVRRGP